MKYPTTLLATVGAGLIVSVAFAAGPDDGIDHIIVTGARAPLPAADIANAVTVITREDIERRQARYVSELLSTVPGFSISQSGVAGSQTQVRVRGSEANHVLVLIDGARANDPATGDEFRWEFLTTANIERIEVVRGPQSALWGSDAIGGVVHIITRSGADDRGFDAYLEGGSNDTRNAALNGSFGDDRWSLALGLERLATDGSNIARAGDERDGSDVTTASIDARFSPSDSFVIRLGARSVDAFSEYDAVDYFATGLPIDSDVATDTAQRFAHVGATIGGGDGRGIHHLDARWFDTENVDLVAGERDASSASERTTVAYQADVPLGRNLLSLVLEHEHTRFEQRGAIVFDDPNQDQEMDVTSAVVDFQGRSSAEVTWLLSARYDDYSDFDDAVTGRASLAWHISDVATLRAAAGTGQKAPTFTERFGYFSQTFAGNDGLTPERSTSFELGMDYDFASVELQLNLFRQDLRDEINGLHCPNPWPSPCTAINMEGQSRRSGVEFGAAWQVSDHVGLGVNYTYTDSQDPDSAAELRRPRHSGSLQANIGFADTRGHVTLAADYGGTRYDMFYPPWPVAPEIVSLENYWLVGLSVRYRVGDSITLLARGSNLLDTRYEQVYGYRTPGRSAYAGVELGFGR